jgi:hypothetical protein
VTRQELRLLQRRAGFHYPRDECDAASVEIELAVRGSLRNPAFRKVLVQLASGMGRHVEERLVRCLVLGRGGEPINDPRGQRLKARFPVLGPGCFEAKPLSVASEVPHLEGAEFTGTQARGKGDFVAQPPMRCA